ncbi:MAG: carboxypeptidase regulatory-like domain-containing protein [Phycisphaerales bacterium]|nr:MAG: carboxypeptidase regulatory-like domain-containing protein [Phycisphaerales bacterium]
MNPAENIEAAIEKLHLKTTARTDRRILSDAFAALDRAVGAERAGLPRRLLTPRTAMLAAAAVLAIAALVIVGLLWINRSGDGQDGVVNDRNGITQPVPEPDSTNRLAAELQQLEQMFAAGDVRGLMAMLSRDRLESKVAAANYLARIGDARAIEALEIQAGRWPGDPADNPFTRAIEQIESGLRPEKQQTPPDPDSKQPAAAPDAFEFKPVGVLSGLVKDAETGEPIKGAKISVQGAWRKETISDANGLYHFDTLEQVGLSQPANVRLQATAEGYVAIRDYEEMPLIALSAGSQAVKHFELEPGCMVDVLVVDEKGEPIPEVSLILTSLASEMGNEVCPSVETDANGLATLGEARPAETEFLITARHKDFAPKGHRLRLNDPAVIEFVELVMEKGTAVTGYAYYLDGVPAEGLEISAKPNWWHCLYVQATVPVDANGLFTLPHVAAGLYSIHVHIATGRSMSTSFAVSQATLPADTGPLLVTVPRKSPGSLVSISGKVTFPGGKRPRTVEVSTYSTSDGQFHNVHLDGNQDTFTIDSLEPGLYDLEFSGSDMEQKVVKNVKAPSSDLVVELKYSEKPKLEGVVVDAKTGSPVRRFRARARKLSTLRGPHYVQANRWVEFKDPRGAFSFEVVGPGVYQVQAAADGFAWTWSPQINTDEDRPVTIQLGAGGSITGRVTDDQGEPVASAAVTALSRAGGSMPTEAEVFVSKDGSVLTDANGVFLLENLVPGSETIKVAHDDYCFTIVRDIEVVDARMTEGVNIALSKGGSVEGCVYDAQGKPQPGVTLFFQDDSGYSGRPGEEAGRLATAVTDANGCYHVEGLPERLCYVKRSNEWESLGVVARVVVPADGRTLRLDFGGKPVISGQLLAAGQPAANATLMLSDPESRYSRVFRCLTLTAPGGGFSFRGAPPGRYGIYYRNPEKRDDWPLLAILETTNEDTDVGAIAPAAGRVVVTLTYDINDISPDDLRVSLFKAGSFWGPSVGTVHTPERPGDPYVIEGVPPGTYTPVAGLPNYMQIFGEPVTLDAGREQVASSLNLSKCTASISGLLITDSQRQLLLWRSDEKVKAYLRKDEAGSYRLDHLPPGRYYAGNYWLGDAGRALEFELAEGWNLTLDVDARSYFRRQVALLSVIVVGEDGVPVSDVKVWLEGPAGKLAPARETKPGFLFMTVEPGQYTLRAVGTGYKDTATGVTLKTRPTDSASVADSTLILRLERR